MFVLIMKTCTYWNNQLIMNWNLSLYEKKIVQS